MTGLLAALALALAWLLIAVGWLLMWPVSVAVQADMYLTSWGWRLAAWARATLRQRKGAA